MKKMINKILTVGAIAALITTPIEAAPEKLGMSKHAPKMKAETYPQQLSDFLSGVINMKDSALAGKSAKAILARAKNNNAFNSAMEIKDPYDLAHIVTGTPKDARHLIMKSKTFIRYFNWKILSERKLANVRDESQSAPFWEDILQTFYIMALHQDDIRQKATNDGTDQTPKLLLTVTGVNDQGYRVSYVDQDGKFQHAFVPKRELQKKYQSLKIGQLLIAKVSLAQPGMMNRIGMGNRLVPQRQVFDFPPALTITDQPDGFPKKTVKIFQDEAQRTTYPPVIPGSISKGLLPRRRGW